MNKLSVRIIAVILCITLCLSGVISAFALTADKKEEKTEAAVSQPVKEDTDDTITKDETVYVLAGADGSVKKIIVSDWIKNALGKAEVNDTSSLTDIENVKGDASCTIRGDGKVWDAQGNDVYYQGNIEKELPVGLSVSYTLDGKEISADELIGKSGKVTIRFDYENRQFENVLIDGKKEKIYVPFAMITGMLLDNDCFRNIEVTNGKLINDGNHTVAMGFALPGMQDNLNIDKDKLDIPDYVEITADATDFRFGMTVTIAANELFNKLDTEKMDSLSGLDDSIDELTDGMNQLLDGSSKLYDGLQELLEKSGELVTGINKLADGAKTLKDGTDALDAGAAKLMDGTAALSNGLNTLKSNNAALNGGAKQVFDTLLSTAQTQISAAGISLPTLTAQNYAVVLNNVIESLDDTTVYNQALTEVTNAVESNRSLIEGKVTEAVLSQVEAQVTAVIQGQVTDTVTKTVQSEIQNQVIASATGMSFDDYNAGVAADLISSEIQMAVSSAIESQMQSEEVKSLINSTVNVKMESEEIKTMISKNRDLQMQSEAVKKMIADNVEIQIQQAISDNMASDAVQSKLAEASAGAQSIISLKASLDSYNTFYLGLLTYTQGVSDAADGAVTLNSGAVELKNGTVQVKDGTTALYDGILQLKNGAPALVDGITQLRDGSMQLNDGLKKFNEEGIQKIVDLIDGDLENLTARFKATVDVSKNYQNFSGISDEMDGQIRFIYRTDEIK